MKPLFFTILLLTGMSRALSQDETSHQTLKGQIKSADQKVMFATVGIVEENLGVITNESGVFEIKIPSEYQNKLLTISHIGYTTLHLNLDSLLALHDVKIELQEKTEILDEVIVSSKRLKGKVKEFGNKKQHDLFLWIQDGDRGSEIVTLMEPKNSIVLNSISMNILNELGKEFTLLVNVYEKDDITNMPGAQLLKSQKIIQSTQKKGWLEVDLTEENIILSKPFYVGFQWVSTDEQLPLIGGTSGTTKKSLIRYNALGSWKTFAEWDIKAKGTIYKTN
jgi:hypothetical protein